MLPEPGVVAAVVRTDTWCRSPPLRSKRKCTSMEPSSGGEASALNSMACSVKDAEASSNHR